MRCVYYTACFLPFSVLRPPRSSIRTETSACQPWLCNSGMDARVWRRLDTELPCQVCLSYISLWGVNINMWYVSRFSFNFSSVTTTEIALVSVNRRKCGISIWLLINISIWFLTGTSGRDPSATCMWMFILQRRLFIPSRASNLPRRTTSRSTLSMLWERVPMQTTTEYWPPSPQVYSMGF